MKNRNFLQSFLTEKCLKKVMCLVLAACLLFTQASVYVNADDNATNTEVQIERNRKSETVREFKERRREALMGGYFRTWHDKYSTDDQGVPHRLPHEANSMGDVPAEVDFLFVFHDWTAPNSIFWEKLREEYVPKLNAQGTKVIRTIGAGFLTGEVGISQDREKYPDTPEGFKKLASDIVDEYVYKHNLDGLDVDVEIHNEPGHNKTGEAKKAEMQKAIAVMKEIAKLIGEHGKDNTRFLIMDTTLHAGRRIRDQKDIGPNNELFIETHKCYDYVLAQVYGAGGEMGDFGKDFKWRTFQPYILPNQFLIGFSFYEEGGKAAGNIWGDTEGTPENSRAARYAAWNPEGGVKGGIFSYAIERDGTREFRDYRRRLDGDNTLRTTTYEWTKSLKQQMKSNIEEYAPITEADFPDSVLREEVARQIGDYRGNIARYNQELVLNNPEITDLTGLDKMVNVKKIHLSGLVNLRNFNLRGMKLETLPEEAGNWNMLESLDVSGNAIDFSEGTSQAKILLQMLENIERNTGALDFENNAKFGNQKPKAYYPESFRYYHKAVQLEKTDDTTTESLSQYATLFGQRTVSNTYVWDEAGFNQLKEQTVKEKRFIEDSYTYDEFKISYDENYAMVEVSDHAANNLQAPYNIDLSKDGSYLIEFFEKLPAPGNTFTKGKKIHEIVVNVGNAPKRSVNVALNATITNHNFQVGINKLDDESHLNWIFDGVVHSQQRVRGFALVNSWFVFDIGENAQANSWKMYNDSVIEAPYPYGGNAGYNINAGSLEYLKDPENADLGSKDYLGDDANWIVAHDYSAAGDLNEVTKTFDEVISARYWRYKIKELSAFRAFSIPEIMIFGSSSVVSAETTEAMLSGKAEKGMSEENHFDIILRGDEFTEISDNMDVTPWISPVMEGLEYKANLIGANNQRVRIVVSGTPKEESSESLNIVVPAEYLKASSENLTVNSNVAVTIAKADLVYAPYTLEKMITLYLNEPAKASFEVLLDEGQFDLIYEGMDITNWMSPQLAGVRYTVTAYTDSKLMVAVSGVTNQVRPASRLDIVIPSHFLREAKKDAHVKSEIRIQADNPPVLSPYQPETSGNTNTVTEQIITEETIALSSAEKALAEELSKSMSQAADKALVEKFVAKKITAKDLVKGLSEKALTEYGQNVEHQFTDEKADNWYAKELSVIRLLNLVKGYEDKTFRGNNNVSGKEMVTFLVRAAGLPLVETKANPSDWFAVYEEAARKAGLLKGVEFDLNKALTREEVAYLAYNMLSRNENHQAKEELKVTDKESISEKYVNAVSYLYENQILKGYEDGSYKPQNNVKRSEVVTILYRLLKH
ncbi:MAG: S-layer homology domain-containing protein [Eubacteriales bacterium]|nr:S-layer homology domain-containing protein [Eubacteriales bacterium]